MRAQVQSETTTTTGATLDVVASSKKPSTTTTTSSSSVDKQNRIPSALQVVFLSSNRGSEVNQPPRGVAGKIYVRNWRFPQQGDGSNNGSKRRSSFTSGDNEEAPAPLPIIRRDSTPNLEGARRRKKKSGLPEDEISPQVLLDEILTERSYSTQSYETLKTAYYNKPTIYQKASYGSKMVEIVRRGDVEGLRKMIDIGLSPNPCNVYGESLVHMVCRRGDVELLEVLVDGGCNLRVSDDYGRTPLHDSCWTAQPAFDVMDLLLKTDPRLLYMKDARGSLPFSYLHKDHWPVWKHFLNDMKDTYFPRLPLGEEQGPPKLAELPPNSLPLPDPKHALPVSMAALLANGKMTTDEIKMLISVDDSNTHEESDSSYSSGDCSDGSEDESGSGGSEAAESTSSDDDESDDNGSC